jgi:DNA-binding Lrp family transcriptional regulator
MSKEYSDLTGRIVRLLEKDRGQPIQELARELKINRTFLVGYLRKRKNILRKLKLYLNLILCILLSTSFFIAIYGLPSSSVELYPIADSYVDSSNPENNYGGSSSLFAEHIKMEYTADLIYNAYLMFDLIGLPSGTIVESASLTIYVFWVGSTTKVYLHFCEDTSWNELEINWRNAPKYVDKPVSVTIMAESMKFYSMDATEAVKQALTKGLNKLTLVVTTEPKTSIGDFIQFDSKESTIKEYRPMLKIAYSIGALTTKTMTTETKTGIVKTASITTEIKWATVTEVFTKTEVQTLKEVVYATATLFKEKPSFSFIALAFIIGLAIGLLSMRLTYKPKGEKVQLKETSKELSKPSVKYCPSCGGELKPLGTTGKSICLNCGKIYD